MVEWYPGQVAKGWRWERIPLPQTTIERWGWVFVTTYANGAQHRVYPDWRFLSPMGTPLPLATSPLP